MYDLLGCNYLNNGFLNPCGTNMAGSLYMMNFYDQLKNYYAGRTAKTADNTGSTGSGTADTKAADFQTAFQEAFRKALQESMGIDGSTVQTASGAAKSAAQAVSGKPLSAQNAYQAVSSYCSHPSHIWTSRFAKS